MSNEQRQGVTTAVQVMNEAVVLRLSPVTRVGGDGDLHSETEMVNVTIPPNILTASIDALSAAFTTLHNPQYVPISHVRG